MIKNLLLICLTIFGFSGLCQNFTATYGFQDVTTSTGNLDPSASPTVTGITLGSFSAVGTSANPAASGRFAFTGWPLGGVNGTDDYSNFTGALSPTVYYEVSLTVNPGYTLSLSTLTFAVRRSGTGIRHYCVRSNLDNYTNNLAASTGTNAKLSVIPNDVFFWNYDSVSTANDQKGSLLNPGNLFSSLTNSVTFRFYAWNSESNGGSFSLDNVSFMGSATNVINAVGISEKIKESSEIKFYPNPSYDGKIKAEASGNKFKVEVSSITGKILLIKEIRGSEKFMEIDLSGCENGIYILKSSSDAGSTSSKIILSKQ